MGDPVFTSSADDPAPPPKSAFDYHLSHPLFRDAVLQARIYRHRLLPRPLQPRRGQPDRGSCERRSGRGRLQDSPVKCGCTPRVHQYVEHSIVVFRLDSLTLFSQSRLRTRTQLTPRRPRLSPRSRRRSTQPRRASAASVRVMSPSRSASLATPKSRHSSRASSLSVVLYFASSSH
jgi:hypothetical protein